MRIDLEIRYCPAGIEALWHSRKIFLEKQPAEGSTVYTYDVSVQLIYALFGGVDNGGRSVAKRIVRIEQLFGQFR